MKATITSHDWQQLAREAPRLVTKLPGPAAASWIARDHQVISPSYTRQYPLVAASGSGCCLFDVDGNLFLDFTAGIAVNSTGFSHPEVVNAISDQAQKLIHMSGTDFYYSPEIELAERLAKLAPGEFPKKVFFANSGTEAIEAAMKLARYHTGRHTIISFFGAFHGRTYGAMSIGASKSLHRGGFGPFVPGTFQTPYNGTLADFQDLFSRVAPPDEIAAIFVEPIQGEGGYRVPDADFLPMLRRICDEHGILLVADEVQSGMGRTGKMFAVEHFGIAPDLICLAKGIASGMPLGALVARADVMDWPPGSHASTFGGNPVCCRAALATLDLIEGEYMENARRRGEQLKQRLKEIASHLDCLQNPRGLGLMVAVDVVDKHHGQSHARDNVIQEAFERGLLLLGCGKMGLRLCPPLCVLEEQVDKAISILVDAVRAAT